MRKPWVSTLIERLQERVLELRGDVDQRLQQFARLEQQVINQATRLYKSLDPDFRAGAQEVLEHWRQRLHGSPAPGPCEGAPCNGTGDRREQAVVPQCFGDLGSQETPQSIRGGVAVERCSRRAEGAGCAPGTPCRDGAGGRWHRGRHRRRRRAPSPQGVRGMRACTLRKRTFERIRRN